jgi:hypothetical protein
VSVDGGCLCGAVRYRAAGPVTHPTLCHCRSCRLGAGAPSVAWVSFPRARFAWTGAAPARYGSSPPVERTFCARCGTSLTYTHSDFGDEIDVTTASLDAPQAFPPRDHTWVEEALPWSELGALPRFPQRRTE